MFELNSAAWAVFAAPIVGSFIGVVVSRHRAPATIVLGRSRCEDCGHPLAILDLVPIASWLASRGRCRHCGRSIGIFAPTIELAAVAIAAWAAVIEPGSSFWAICLLGWMLLGLAAIDFREHRLPDFLTIPLLIAGLGESALYEPERFSDHAIGAAAGYCAVIAIRAAYWRLRGREGIGLGDAKLLAAAGAWASWEALPSIVALGAGAALVWIVCRPPRDRGPLLTQEVPFGAFLCFGIWIVALYGPLP